MGGLLIVVPVLAITAFLNAASFMRGQEVGRSIDEVLRALDALQISDEKKVSMPEGWPKNELIGDEVIIPTPKDAKTAMARKKGPGCYDWWFCHKKLGGKV